MDNRANYQVDIGGNVFIAIQNMFAEFTKIVQVVEKVDESVQNSTRQITEHVDKSANAFGGLQKQIERISLTSIIEQVKQLAEGVANLTGPGIGFEQSMADLSSITGIATWGKSPGRRVRRADWGRSRRRMPLPCWPRRFRWTRSAWRG